MSGFWNARPFLDCFPPDKDTKYAFLVSLEVCWMEAASRCCGIMYVLCVYAGVSIRHYV